MFVSEIMSKCVAECTEDMSLEEVYALLRQCDQGIVVVLDSHAHRVPIGVVTERSICEQIIARGRNPKSLAAGSVMDSRIRKVSEDAAIEGLEAAGDDVVATVVVDGGRRICGLVTKESLKSVPKTAAKAFAKPVQRAVPAVRPSGRKISEIPAFGWA